MSDLLLIEAIGAGIHTYLRKLLDSPEGARAWKAINDLPDDEWSAVVKEVAKNIESNYARIEKPREQIEGWIYPCEGPIFYYNTYGDLCIKVGSEPSKDNLPEWDCECLKNCKPKKIKIVVVDDEEK